MVGFMPGFAYLGGLAPELTTPRRSSPRTAVPAGTVGIGGQQTGVYPLVSPGGWNLIGRTPLRIFDVSRENASLLEAGDHVRFVPILRTDFDNWTISA
jgi:KipI family sensor histidine kinase inhibitor